MKHHSLRRLIVATLAASAIVAGAHANGYKVLGIKSAKATAMGEAFIVQADDPSALTFNPAGLAQLEGSQVNLQATVCGAYTKHTAPSGETTRMEEQWQTVPALYAISDAGLKNVVIGVGMSMPNGLSSEWADDSFARYVATFSNLLVADLSPAAGFRLSNNLLLGVGLDFYWSQARLESMVDLGLQAGAPGMLDAGGRMKGDGSAWGANAGLIYRLTPRHSMALTYRLPYSIEYKGDYSLAAAGIQTDAKASIDFPAVAVAGYAFRPTESWKVEFNLDWTDWNAVDDIRMDFENPYLPDTVQEQGLKNTFAFKLGAEYAWSKALDLRAGYIYNENATPERTWRPSLPDTDVHFLTAGFGYDLGNLTLDAALQLIFYEKRAIDNNVDNNEWVSSSSVDGEYETWAPCLSLAATYRF